MVARLDEATTAKHPIRSGGLASTRVDRMHETMRRYVESGRLPGLVTGVSRGGFEQIDAVGTIAFGNSEPMRRDTIFRLASMTKPITAVATMILVEECRVRLDDPVDAWLPELADRKVLRTIDSSLEDTVPAKRSITLRDLLTFRAGYGEVLFQSWNCPMQKALADAQLPLVHWPFSDTADEFMKRLGKLPLVHQPGERWLYHMCGEILGVLVARVARQSLGLFFRERIFEPLGMKDTAFFVPEEKMNRLPPCYRTDPSTGQVAIHDAAAGGLYAHPPVFEGGGGGLVSTVDDMLAFGRMMLGQNGGRDRILSRPTIELMTMDHLTPEQKAASPFFPSFWDAYGWGLGLAVIARRHELGRGPGCFGWDGTFGTSWWIDPVEDIVGVLMSQRVPDTMAMPPIVGDFWTSVYQSIVD